jgi:hypothetical protein
MAKITEKKFNEYKEINKNGGVNGFKINLYSILYQFAHGDEYPKFSNLILDDDKIQIVASVTFFKYYRGNGEYVIKVNEYKKSKDKDNKFMITGTGYFEKEYLKIETLKGENFSFKTLKDLCNKFDIEELKTQALKDYDAYKNNKNNLKVVI